MSYRLSNTRLAFFLKEVGASPVGNGSAPLQRAEPFVVFQTKELPVLNVTLGPFSTGLVLPKEQLQPSSTLEVPDRLTVNWKVRAFIIQPRLVANQPVVQVLFYVAGRDWDDFDVTDRLPCVRLHAFRDAREIKSSCRLRGSLAMCLVQAELPHAWFGPPAVPLGRRKSPESLEVPGESQQAELYYTLHAPDGAGQCLGEMVPPPWGWGGQDRGSHAAPAAAHRQRQPPAAPPRAAHAGTSAGRQHLHPPARQAPQARRGAEHPPLPDVQLHGGALHAQVRSWGCPQPRSSRLSRGWLFRLGWARGREDGEGVWCFWDLLGAGLGLAGLWGGEGGCRSS